MMLSFLGAIFRGRFTLLSITHSFESLRFYVSMDARTLSSYEEAVYALNGLQSNAVTLQKARVERDVNAHRNVTHTIKHLKTLGIQLSDLDSLNIIHVAGTKGKGSTCAFTESILRKQGFKTGFYSSPHLVSVNERIRINGLPIDKNLFTKYFWEVYKPLQHSLENGETMLPYFMFLTIMAFYIFLKEKIQATVLEVGVGGLFDCTNVIKKPVVVGLTSLGIDHVHLLGSTLPEIAAQKAGIFKFGVPAFTVCQHESAMEVLRDKAKKVDCPLKLAPPIEVYEQNMNLNFPSVVQNTNASLALQLTITWLKHMSGNSLLDSNSMQYNNLENDQLFTAMASPFPIDSKFREGLESCVWPGRFQTIEKSDYTLYIDGAHTQQSMKHCIKWFRDTSTKQQEILQHPVLRILLFNCTGERKAENLLDPLSDMNFDLVVFSPNRKSVMKDSSSDQSNFMVDPQQELQQCITNKEIWCHLMRSLCENELSMASQSSATYILHETELAMLKEDNILMFCCLSNAVDWLLHRKFFSHCSSCDKSNSFTHLLERAHHLQILVTGSLHLVGGVMALTGSEP